ncbi:MAG TPA: glycoside hydrolase family 3 C-terminal domain-containing protein [Chthoniobacteraceae bacterium]|jgi:beta-glucosidase|nr:glycoside hydrolase family 3 C-terminal domain-containing protein [Chthoniobacteraceae bacterium]
MKKSAVLLFLVMAATSMAAAPATSDETAPSPCGKSIEVIGSFEHYRTPVSVEVSGDPHDGTYQQEVFGSNFSAKIDGLAAGTYTVRIDEAEVYHKGAGQRVMKITSGDTVIAPRLDIFAKAGFATALAVEGKVKHQDDSIGGPLTITFTSIKGDAKFNAISILDEQGETVACVKAADLMSAADAAATAVPDVKEPAIYLDPDKPMDARIDDLIRRMSLAEKVSQLVNVAVAIPRLKVPAYNYWSECLHGVARNGHATVFPQAIGMAATWDNGLIHEEGKVIADEARAKYYQAIRDGEGGRDNRGLNFWAPNVNIFRDPRWGRGQETYGEDPWLTSRMGVAFITGIQQTSGKYLEAMACAKHFAVHDGPEPGRGGFDVDPATRDLYETYLPQFEACVREGHVGAVMAAYNAIYGVPCACNPWLLTDLLRNTWGFTGHVVSDCGAVGNIVGNHHYATDTAHGDALAIKAGLDLNCGGAYMRLTHSVAEGLCAEADIDRALHRVLAIRFRLGLFDPQNRVPFSNIPMSDVESPAHLAVSLQVARESMVLLINRGVLPLDKSKLKRIAVIGANANDNGMLYANYAGSETNPVNILKGIRDAAGVAVTVDFVKGCPLGPNRGPAPTEDTPEFQKAVATAKAADAIIYVGGLNTMYEGEESSFVAPGFNHGDRTSIELPDIQDKMLRALQATGKPVIFVNCSGSAIAMPWEVKNLAAILQAWYPGGQGGVAVADVLFGNYNPAGRLPVTFYQSTADLPGLSDYRMANRTYRYFKGTPLFPFGYGLTYTRFDYGAPVLQPASVTGNVDLTVPVTNAGGMDGDEVVQVYMRHKDSPVPQAIRSLVAFQRVHIAKGATVPVHFQIPAERFRYWSIADKKYVVDPGSYELQIGASSADIRRKCDVSVPGGLSLNSALPPGNS